MQSQTMGSLPNFFFKVCYIKEGIVIYLNLLIDLNKKEDISFLTLIICYYKHLKKTKTNFKRNVMNPFEIQIVEIRNFLSNALKRSSNIYTSHQKNNPRFEKYSTSRLQTNLIDNPN